MHNYLCYYFAIPQLFDACVHLIILSYSFPFFCPFPSLPPILLSHSLPAAFTTFLLNQLSSVLTLFAPVSHCNLTTFLLYQFLSDHFIFSPFWLHSLCQPSQPFSHTTSHQFILFSFSLCLLLSLCHPHNPHFTLPVLCSYHLLTLLPNSLSLPTLQSILHYQFLLFLVILSL